MDRPIPRLAPVISAFLPLNRGSMRGPMRGPLSVSSLDGPRAGSPAQRNRGMTAAAKRSRERRMPGSAGSMPTGVPQLMMSVTGMNSRSACNPSATCAGGPTR